MKSLRAIAKSHYEKFNIEDRIELIMHNGGHKAVVEDGLRFMTLWLKTDLIID